MHVRLVMNTVWVGSCIGRQKHTCLRLAKTIYIYGLYAVYLAGISPIIRSYSVYIYGFGQPYTCFRSGSDNKGRPNVAGCKPAHKHNHAYTQAHKQIHTRTHNYIHANTHTSTHAHIHPCTHRNTHIHARIHTITYTHTHPTSSAKAFASDASAMAPLVPGTTGTPQATAASRAWILSPMA